MPVFICPKCARHVPRRAPRCDHCNADLRKDYPIDRVQPIVEYRDSNEMTKQAPFGIEEGQPFARIDWEARLGADKPTQVSPAIAQQQGETRTLSDSAAALGMEAKLKAKREAAAAEQGAKE